MNLNWSIEFSDDPLAAVQAFLVEEFGRAVHQAVLVLNRQQFEIIDGELWEKGVTPQPANE